MTDATPAAPRPTALVADGDAGDAASLTLLLDAVGLDAVVAPDGLAALRLADDGDVAAAVIDVDLPALSGYHVCSVLRRTRGRSLPIVLVSSTRTESLDRVAGLLLGADDYLAKPVDADALLARLRVLLERVPVTPSARRLTPREREVLALLAAGLGQDEIARRLVVSAKTVATHIEHILRKLDVHSRAQAVAVAYRDALVS